MRWVELQDGDEVVMDVGHSGGVVGLAVSDGLVVSGGDDGYVCVRGRDGHSVVPPMHVREVTTVVRLPGTSTCVVGTLGHTHGLDVGTGDSRPLGGMEDTSVADAVVVGDAAVVACRDGSVRSIAFGSGVRTLATLDEPLVRIATCGSGVVVTDVAGRVVLLDQDWATVWSLPLLPGEVAHVVALADAILVGGDGPTVGGGRMALIDAATGALEREVDIPVPVMALVRIGDSVAVALGDGTVRSVDGVADLSGPRLGDTLGSVDGIGVEVLAAGPDGLWFGGADGRVGRVDGTNSLPARSSGVFAMAFRDPGERAIGTDGRRLLTYDLRDGTSEAILEIDGVVALTWAGPDDDDVVVAYADGRLERRRAPDLTEVVATGQVPLRPRALGWIDDLVVAEDDDDFAVVGAVDLEAAYIDVEEYDRVSIARRNGNAFTGHGSLVNLDVAVVDTTGIVVARPGMLGINEQADSVLRVWRTGGFVG